MTQEMPHFDKDLNGEGDRYGLVVSRFNQEITNQLLEGAIEGLKQHGVSEEELTIAWVPGAFEIPLIAKKLAESKKYDAVICLGAVIRGETSHFDFVADQAARGILQASLASGIPVIFSVLTTDTVEQAEVRAKNKGLSGALSAIEMVNIIKSIQ